MKLTEITRRDFLKYVTITECATLGSPFISQLHEHQQLILVHAENGNIYKKYYFDVTRKFLGIPYQRSAALELNLMATIIRLSSKFLKEKTQILCI